jgi:tRNA(Ser,Leu) C12 N-acetylase TAN1
VLFRSAKDGKAVLTNNGKPQALIFKIDGESFERTLMLLQKLEFMQNICEMRLESMRNGNADMSLDEINAEITAARKERTKTAKR